MLSVIIKRLQHTVIVVLFLILQSDPLYFRETTLIYFKENGYA